MTLCLNTSHCCKKFFWVVCLFHREEVMTTNSLVKETKCQHFFYTNAHAQALAFSAWVQLTCPCMLTPVSAVF